MKTKILTTLAAAAALGLTAVAAPQPAQAGHWHGGGGAVAAGVIGGLAAGAIIGSAAANGPYYGLWSRLLRLRSWPGLLRRLLLDPPANLGRLGLARKACACL